MSFWSVLFRSEAGFVTLAALALGGSMLVGSGLAEVAGWLRCDECAGYRFRSVVLCPCAKHLRLRYKHRSAALEQSTTSTGVSG